MMIALKTKRPHVVAYLRPSVKALPGTQYHKAGEVVLVHPFIRGWFEIRVADEAGGHAEFIPWKQLKYKIKFFVPVLIRRLKSKLK